MVHSYKPVNAPLIALCLGYFLVILDTTAVNVALPELGKSLHASITGLQWVVDGYTVIFASLLLSVGAMADRIGSKKTFQFGFILFTISSVLCGTALFLQTLILFRMIQGLGAALMVPASLALIQSSYPDKVSRARAIGIWGSVAGIAAAGGPTLGGLLITSLGWRSVFFVNVPIGVLGLILTAHFVVETTPAKAKYMDVWGGFTSMIGLGSLAYGLIESGRVGWASPIVTGSMTLFVVSFIGFLLIERHTKHPMLPLSLFQTSTFSVANFVGLMLNLGFYGQLFVLSLFFQKVCGLSPLLTGLAMLPETSMAVLASHLGGLLSGRIGPKYPIIIGLAVGVCGFLGLLTANIHVQYGWLMVPLIAIGFGTAFTMPAATISAVEAVPSHNAGMASGALNTSRQVGGVIGVALLGTFVIDETHFILGMHEAMIVAGIAFFLGLLVTGLWMRNRYFE